jgi:solute:Na+ symporter, SSS family
MNPVMLLLIFLSYFLVLLFISIITGKNSDSQSFYNGNKKSPWFVVSLGMIGVTISGVTFISVPGEVGSSAFYYFQFVLGNVVGYFLIAFFLIPFYYRNNVVSIYSVLENKMGKQGYLTTSGFFIVSKLVGASFRLFLAALVINMVIPPSLGIGFGTTVFFCLIFIWLYTFKSGIKTVVWSDLLQTIILLTAVALTIYVLWGKTGIHIGEMLTSAETKIFNWNWHSQHYFFKQFFAGIFMTLALNGFDQDIMQKNLTCKNSVKAKKNMLIFALMFGFSVLIFLVLGFMLYRFSELNGIDIPQKTDQLFPLIALNYLGPIIAILFILGISASAFSSADSALTSLTTAFCIDFLKIDKMDERKQRSVRTSMHLIFAGLVFLVIYAFYKFNDQSVVVSIFKAAGYTYGPILGVFLFSFFVKRTPKQGSVLPICLVSPFLTFGITKLVGLLSSGFNFGFELIIINSFITLFLLFLFSSKRSFL